MSILQIRASFLCLSFFITALLRMPEIPLCSGVRCVPVFQVLEALLGVWVRISMGDHAAANILSYRPFFSMFCFFSFFLFASLSSILNFKMRIAKQAYLASVGRLIENKWKVHMQTEQTSRAWYGTQTGFLTFAVEELLCLLLFI